MEEKELEALLKSPMWRLISYSYETDFMVLKLMDKKGNYITISAFSDDLKKPIASITKDLLESFVEKLQKHE